MLVALILVASFVVPLFPTAANAQSIAAWASFLAVVALGVTFVILTGGVDLSSISVHALSGVDASWVSGTAR